MKKIFIVSLMAILALMPCPSTVISAREMETTLPDPGIAPDSPFYFVDQWGKSISLMFTFNAENKLQKALRYADERMAEMDAMMAQNRIREATHAASGYQYYLEVADKSMEQVRLMGGDISEEVALMMEKHLGYLCDKVQNATEDASALMMQTRERVMTCQVTALRNMAQGDPEKATQFNLKLMEGQLSRVRVQAEDGNGEAVQARLEVFNRLGNLGEEILQIAKRVGKEAIVDQLVGLATTHQLGVLAQIHECVQGETREAVEATIQNCVLNHEQTVIRLQAQKQLGEVPDELPMPEDAPEALRQRVFSGESRGR